MHQGWASNLLPPRHGLWGHTHSHPAGPHWAVVKGTEDLGLSGLQWGGCCPVCACGSWLATGLNVSLLGALRGASWKRSCTLVPLAPSTGVAPLPEPAPRPSPLPADGWQRSQEGLWPFLLGLYSFHTGLPDFPPGCPRLGLLSSPRGGPRGIPLYRKPAGRRALSEGPSALGGTWGRRPACGVSAPVDGLIPPTDMRHLPPSARHGQQEDSSPPEGVHAQGRTGTSRAGEDPSVCAWGDEGPCILLFAVPVEGAEVVASPSLSERLLGRPHALPSLRPWGRGACPAGRPSGGRQAWSMCLQPPELTGRGPWRAERPPEKPGVPVGAEVFLGPRNRPKPCRTAKRHPQSPAVGVGVGCGPH